MIDRCWASMTPFSFLLTLSLYGDGIFDTTDMSYYEKDMSGRMREIYLSHRCFTVRYINITAALSGWYQE